MSEDGSNVIRLIERSAVGAVGHDDLCQWLQNWLDAFKAGHYGEFRAMVLLVQRNDADGAMAALAQATAALNTAELTGMLTIAAMEVSAGKAKIHDLEAS